MDGGLQLWVPAGIQVGGGRVSPFCGQHLPSQACPTSQVLLVLMPDLWGLQEAAAWDETHAPCPPRALPRAAAGSSAPGHLDHGEEAAVQARVRPDGAAGSWQSGGCRQQEEQVTEEGG